MLSSPVTRIAQSDSAREYLRKYDDVIPFNLFTVVQLNFKNIVVKPIILNESLVGLFLADSESSVLGAYEKLQELNLILTDFALPIMLIERERISMDLAKKMIFGGIRHETVNDVATLQTEQSEAKRIILGFEEQLGNGKIEWSEGGQDHQGTLFNFLEKALKVIGIKARDINSLIEEFGALVDTDSVREKVEYDLTEKIRLFVQYLQREGELRGFELKPYNVPMQKLIVQMSARLKEGNEFGIEKLPIGLYACLKNIYHNSIWAMEQPGALFKLGDKAFINLQLTRMVLNKRAWAEIRFTDSGIGIDPKNLRRVFDWYFTTKDTPHSSGIGNPPEKSGHGLSICFELIQAYGGTIFALSEGRGKGCSIVIRIPLVEGDKK